MPTQDELANLIYGTRETNGGGVVSELEPGMAHINPEYFIYFSQVTVNSRWLANTTNLTEPNLAGAVDFLGFTKAWVPKHNGYHIMLVHD